MGDAASHQPGDYKEPALPEGVLEVRVSVYKLKLTGTGFLDGIGASMLGAYHSGLVVAGQEWSYGGHEEEGITGVYTTDPELNPDYSFYQRVIMGRVKASREEVETKIQQLAEKWMGTGYELTEQNCNHFTSEACWLIMKKRPPEWINQTCENIQRSRQKMKAEQASMAETFAIWEKQAVLPPTANPSEGEDAANPFAEPANPFAQGEPAEGEVPEIPGEKALKDTHEKTFEAAWSKHWQAAQKRIQSLSEGEDPEEVKARVTEDALTKAAVAAQAAALEVAKAALKAKAARAQQPEEGLDAWDQVWIKQSGVLVKSWREAAINGNLKDEDLPKRQELLDAALTSAAARAKAVADAAAVAREAAEAAEAAAAAAAKVKADAEAAAAKAKAEADAAAEAAAAAKAKADADAKAAAEAAEAARLAAKARAAEHAATATGS
mmetsp:Transcript_84642/g.149912  ORF Transcript_84642/g.149912 Transcript_84642/m.149912 type:complete len:438 (-) Transcript_84642:50-1363(-)